MLALALSCALFGPTVPIATVQSDAPKARVLSSQVGGPLIVNGVEIEPEAIALYLIYGPARAELEYHRRECLIEWGIRMRRFEGLPGVVDVTEARVAWELNEIRDEFREQYPTLELSTEIRRAHRSTAWWEREVAQDLRFDHVFLPDNPDHWLPCSLEALRAQAGDVLIDDYRESYQRRVENTTFSSDHRDQFGAPGIQPDNRMYRTILRQIVDESLSSAFAPRTTLDGLPKELALTLDCDGDAVEDLVVTTHEAWAAIRLTVTPAELAEARKFLALIESTRQRLGGSVPSVAESRERAEETQSGLMICAGTKGSPIFPSTESYWQYARLLNAYEDLIASRLRDSRIGELSPLLTKHLARANPIMGLARVECEVLFTSAFDFEAFRWKPHGWIESKQRAEDLIHQAKASPAHWGRLLEEENDFWDPPLPTRHHCTSGRRTREGGRFYVRTRNDLRWALHESPFTELLTGESVTDRIFFDAATDEFCGPYKGQWGYYIVRVTDRLDVVRPLDLENPRHRELLALDYARHSFIQFAHEALAQSSVTGLRFQN